MTCSEMERLDIEARVGRGNEWISLRGCIHLGPEHFFGGAGGNEPTVQARAACACCPVLLACLADEVGRPVDEIVGFRAGLSPRARRRLLHRVSDPWEPARRRRAVVRLELGESHGDLEATFQLCVRQIYRWRDAGKKSA